MKNILSICTSKTTHYLVIAIIFVNLGLGEWTHHFIHHLLNHNNNDIHHHTIFCVTDSLNEFSPDEVSHSATELQIGESNEWCLFKQILSYISQSLFILFLVLLFKISLTELKKFSWLNYNGFRAIRLRFKLLPRAPPFNHFIAA